MVQLFDNGRISTIIYVFINRLENLDKAVKEQEEDIDNLDQRVTVTEENVDNIGKEVDETKKDVKNIKEDVNKVEGRVDELEVVVDETVERVDDLEHRVTFKFLALNLFACIFRDHPYDKWWNIFSVKIS